MGSGTIKDSDSGLMTWILLHLNDEAAEFVSKGKERWEAGGDRELGG